ncbi:MAG: patatin-like phospholipase family protein [Actinomycetota bacterium]
MSRAFVLSGGASHGAMQVGMMAALADEGVRPEMVAGTSVGAINAAWIAGGGSPAGLGAIWSDLHRRDLFPNSVVRAVRAFAGRAPSFFPDTGLRRVLRDHLPFDRLEDAELPITVIATDELTGEEVRLRRGPAVDAIAASASIPALLPPVVIDGRRLVDGAVVNNTPITVAIEEGATEVWVLTTGFGCAVTAPPARAFASALRAVGLMVERRLVLELANARYPVPVHLVPSPCTVDVSPIDFSRSDELIDMGYETVASWLRSGRPTLLDAGDPHLHP